MVWCCLDDRKGDGWEDLLQDLSAAKFRITGRLTIPLSVLSQVAHSVHPWQRGSLCTFLGLPAKKEHFASRLTDRHFVATLRLGTLAGSAGSCGQKKGALSIIDSTGVIIGVDPNGVVGES